MDENDNSPVARLEAIGDPPPPSADAASADGPSVGARVGVALAVATVAVAAGGAILAAAVAWGAAEAAVGVGAAYLVYTAITDQRGDLASLLAVRLIGGFRRPPPASEGPGEPAR